MPPQLHSTGHHSISDSGSKEPPQLRQSPPLPLHNLPPLDRSDSLTLPACLSTRCLLHLLPTTPSDTEGPGARGLHPAAPPCVIIFPAIMIPAFLSVISTLVFEFLGMLSDLPAHTKRCKGPPYHRRDAFWGLCAALLVAVLNLYSYHVYTLSYGCGIMVFAVRGAKRKYSSLW
ncbi:unnamed protein product [Coregonus sp. 'balchen']|nr:unnamed protein product [Coregonus sp. 'balchen']